MAFKERITVLFPEAEDIGRCSDQNETHISIKGCNNVTIQRRRIWTHPEPIDDDSVTRITWRNPLISIKQSSVIEPALNSGLNIYFNSSNRYKEPYVKTPVFNLIHKETFELEKYLSNVLNYSNFEWNPQDTNYDILIDNKSTTLIEYRTLSEQDEISFGKSKNVKKEEIGLFYMDSFDETDVNLSGIRCSWKDESPLMEKCLKTTLFYKPAFINNGPELEQSVPISVEEPVGLHPKINIDLSTYEQLDSCQYYFYSQLPLQIFVDKFQSSPIFVFGEDDLELPTYKIASWGSEVLFELNPEEVNEIVLHSRYVKPTNDSETYENVSFTPIILRACDTSSNQLTHNPFYSKGFGFEASLFYR